MDVKVNNHKSWLGLSTLEASGGVARLGGCGLRSPAKCTQGLPWMHPSEQSSLPGTAFRSQPLRWHSRWVRFQPTLPPPRTSLQPRLVVERCSGMDKGQEFGTAGSAWVTASPRRFRVHSVVPRRGSVLFRRQQHQAAGAWLGSLWPSAIVTCHGAVRWRCLASRVTISRALWQVVGGQSAFWGRGRLPVSAV